MQRAACCRFIQVKVQNLTPRPSYPAKLGKTPTMATSLVSGFLLKKCQLSNPHTEMQRAAYCRFIQVKVQNITPRPSNPAKLGKRPTGPLL